MFKQLIILLKSKDWLNESEAIEIAKGKYELPTTWKGVKRKAARQWQLKK